MGADLHIITTPALTITLNLPIPPSVNRLRRIDWASNHTRQQYYLRNDLFLTAYGPKPAPVRRIRGPYEITIQVPERSGLDLDNHVKPLIDYLVSREFVGGDSKRHLRKLVVEWCASGAECHVTITETA